MDNEILQFLKSMQNGINEKFDDLEKEIKSIRIKLDDIETQENILENKIIKEFEELSQNIVVGHENLKDNIRNINSNIKYLSHKIDDNERELFNVKDNLKLIK